jgi:hypothetical protein
MNAHTFENIIRLTDPINHTLHQTSIVYIQTLILPYVQVLEPAAGEDIARWIPLAFPENLANAITSEFNQNVESMKLEYQLQEITEEQAMAGKNSIIEYIINEILQAADVLDSDESGGSDYVTIFPWDIQRCIAEDVELSQLFGITPDQKTLPRISKIFPVERTLSSLPIIVMIGPQKFTHMLTIEFAMGLLLFSDPAVGNHDYHITMFDIPLTTDFSMIVNNNRYTLAGEGDRHFKVTVADRIYRFDTPDFMHGFSTGAMWANVDHHLYWKDLTQYISDENGMVTTTSITF